jgi:hypothetical protein
VPFIGAEGKRDGRTVEGNDRRWWSAMMVVEAAVLGGDRPGSDGRGVVLRPFQKRKGEGRCRLRVRMRGVSGGAGRSARGGRRPGRAGWLGWPKAEAQWRFGSGGPKEGKGEWAGWGGRRGGLRLGRIWSRARIQKKLFLNFN